MSLLPATNSAAVNEPYVSTLPYVQPLPATSLPVLNPSNAITGVNAYISNLSLAPGGLYFISGQLYTNSSIATSNTTDCLRWRINATSSTAANQLIVTNMYAAYSGDCWSYVSGYLSNNNSVASPVLVELVPVNNTMTNGVYGGTLFYNANIQRIA